MNRLQRLDAVKACRSWAEMAAIHNEGWASNPYPHGSYFWALWAEVFQRTIEQIAEREGQSQ